MLYQARCAPVAFDLNLRASLSLLLLYPVFLTCSIAQPQLFLCPEWLVHHKHQWYNVRRKRSELVKVHLPYVWLTELLLWFGVKWKAMMTEHPDTGLCLWCPATTSSSFFVGQIVHCLTTCSLTLENSYILKKKRKKKLLGENERGRKHNKVCWRKSVVAYEKGVKMILSFTAKWGRLSACAHTNIYLQCHDYSTKHLHLKSISKLFSCQF